MAQATPVVTHPERGLGRLSTALAAAVGIEFALGMAALVEVPAGRPSGLLPTQGREIYLAHAIVGLFLALGAMSFIVGVRGHVGMLRLGARVGGIGVAAAGIGGILVVAHPLRLVGIILMFLGSLAAGFGYLLPAFDHFEQAPPVDPERQRTTPTESS